MITAVGMADALTSSFITLVQPGADRPVTGLEMIELGDGVIPDKGDLVLAVGAQSVEDVTQLVHQARAASGLVLRHPWVDGEAVQELCAAAGLPLLAVAPDVTWTALVVLLRRALDNATSSRPDEGAADRLHHDLFDMADTIGAILDAPVTIEDASSRVLAYSTGQTGIDEARMSTIVGRQVPREVRDHFRALGVFRRLANSDVPLFVPAGGDVVKARYVVPIRAGGVWLGSVWAVMDTPVPEARASELRAAAEVVALYLLRLRAQSELHREVQLDQIRTVLRGGFTAAPNWLGPGPWRIATLAGPVDDMSIEARFQLWQAISRRRGWRQPLMADLDTAVYVVLREHGTGPGTWSWLCDFVGEESVRNPSVRVTAGGPVDTVSNLSKSRTTADELARLGVASLEQPVASIESAWTEVVLGRAVAGLTHTSLVSPVKDLVADERDTRGELVATLSAVIDFWGEPRRAAAALGVHPNTVRNRMSRLTECWTVDLDDPRQRLALRLEIAAVLGTKAPG